MKITIAAVAALLSLTPVAPAQAGPHDTRPCVTKTEFYSTPVRGMDRHKIEQRWDVVDLGYTDHTRTWYYKVCGQPMSEAHAEIWLFPHSQKAWAVAWVTIIGTTADVPDSLPVKTRATVITTPRRVPN